MSKSEPSFLENSPIESIVNSATNAPLEDMAVNDTKNVATPEEIQVFIKKVSDSFGIPSPTAFTGIALLFLKGAANKGAPPTMSVDLLTPEKTPISLTKYDLQCACQVACKNKFLRRVAKGLAKEIGFFAESKNLNGDLAIKLNNNLVAEGEPPLTSKEKAWASSFSQTLPNLEKLSGSNRVPTLLAQDYQDRFLSNTKKSKANKSEQAPASAKPVAPAAAPKAGKKGPNASKKGSSKGS